MLRDIQRAEIDPTQARMTRLDGQVLTRLPSENVATAVCREDNLIPKSRVTNVSPETQNTESHQPWHGLGLAVKVDTLGTDSLDRARRKPYSILSSTSSYHRHVSPFPSSTSVWWCLELKKLALDACSR